MPGGRLARIEMGAALAAVLAASALAGAEANSPGQALSFPYAGISLVIPSGFRCRPVSDPFEIMQAEANDRPGAFSIGLSAFPVEEGVSAAAFSDAMLGDLARNPAVKRLKVLGQAPMVVGFVEGAAARLSYVQRGLDVGAVWVHFVRQQSSPAVRLCYMLSFRTSADRQAELARVVTDLVQGVRFPPLQRPWEALGKGYGPRVDHPHWGLGLRPPQGWYVSAVGPSGVSTQGAALTADPLPLFRTGQVDFFSGGFQGMDAQVLAARGPAGQTSESAVKACVHLLARGRAVAQSPAEMLGREGYQVILRVPGEAAGLIQNDAASGSMTGIRGVCLPARGDGASEFYAVTLRCPAGDANSMGDMLGYLAGGLELRPVTSQPSSEPGTQAASQPASQAISAPTSEPTSGPGALPSGAPIPLRQG